jgi:hypothetical protein
VSPATWKEISAESRPRDDHCGDRRAFIYFSRVGREHTITGFAERKVNAERVIRRAGDLVLTLHWITRIAEERRGNLGLGEAEENVERQGASGEGIH